VTAIRPPHNGQNTGRSWREERVRGRVKADDGVPKRSRHDSLVELGRDVRNGLQGIVGALDLILRTPLTAEQREYVGYASSAAEELEASVNRTEAELSLLADVASNRAADSMERILTLTREFLNMDVSFIARFEGNRMVFHALDGDAVSFGWQEGAEVPLDGTFCQRVVGGEIPSVIPDAKADERVAHLDITREADIGSYVGIPLRFSDGRVYGTLCCLGQEPDPHLQQRDAKFMEVLARLLADQLEREEVEESRGK
jgi:transcriptional regulator with GAF, ATPase, and Fis domain